MKNRYLFVISGILVLAALFAAGMYPDHPAAGRCHDCPANNNGNSHRNPDRFCLRDRELPWIYTPVRFEYCHGMYKRYRCRGPVQEICILPGSERHLPACQGRYKIRQVRCMCPAVREHVLQQPQPAQRLCRPVYVKHSDATFFVFLFNREPTVLP